MNSRPSVYKTAALPLCYAGDGEQLSVPMRRDKAAGALFLRSTKAKQDSLDLACAPYIVLPHRERAFAAAKSEFRMSAFPEQFSMDSSR